MQRSSWLNRSRRRRGTTSLAVVAAVAAVGIGSTAAPAGAAKHHDAKQHTAKRAHRQKPATAGKACGVTTDATSGATWSSVRISASGGVSCATARKVVGACMERAAVKGWKRSGATSAPGLRDGNRRIGIDATGEDLPTCVEDRDAHVSPAEAHGEDLLTTGTSTTLGATSYRTAGPFEGPQPLPPTSSAKWHWTTPVVSSQVQSIDVGSAVLWGAARTTDEKVRSVWFEYGKTRDLGVQSERQPPKFRADDEAWGFGQTLHGLSAQTRYYWRAMATLDTDEGVRTFSGATGSFVTEPYRSIGGDNPCSQTQFGGRWGGTTEVTEALALVCSPRMELVNSTWVPLSVGYNGRLTCPRDFPRNLNAGDTEVTIPKIDYTVKFNDKVSFWRSNGSARFTTFPGYQKHFGGAQDGPLVGWHDWDIDQWGYLGSTSRTDVQLWIACTDNFRAISTEQLARGEGDDAASRTPPAAPGNFSFTQAADGSYNGSWSAPGTVAGGIAGYELIVDSLQDSSRLAALLVTNTGTNGTLPASYIKAMADIYRTKSLYAHVWAISGEGVRSATSATIAVTAP